MINNSPRNDIPSMVVKLISNMGVSTVKSIVDMKYGINGKIHIINGDVPRTGRS